MRWSRWVVLAVGAYIGVAAWLEFRRVRQVRERQRWLDAADRGEQS